MISDHNDDHHHDHHQNFEHLPLSARFLSMVFESAVLRFFAKLNLRLSRIAPKQGHRVITDFGSRLGGAQTLDSRPQTQGFRSVNMGVSENREP